nr:hypothetical protein BaRGS_013355 [Batillaria attramentaria]
MDSPGLYDTSKTQEEICTIIVQAVACMHPGPHAILYVVKIDRYTDEEYGVYNRLKKLFDASITKYIIILFTGGDELEAAGKSLADMLRAAPHKLIQVVEECNHRCMIFNNKAKDKQPQVNRLLDQVRKMNAENNNSPYACPKYASVGKGLEAEVARRLAEVNKRDAEREQYVKELEERKAKAEEELKRTKRNFQRKEREREKELQEEREKREREKEELREKLKKKETEAEIQEKKKKSAGKDEDREEEEKKAEALARQQEELRQSILRREREQEELLKRLEEERKREREEIRRREQEREELERKRREEERKEKERQRRAYEEEMRRMKEQIAENKEQGWVDWATKGVSKWLGW